jgi:hypothetical protein
MGPGLFPGVKRSLRDVDHPAPSSVEVKARVELYQSSPSASSWHATGWTLPCYFYAEDLDPGTIELKAFALRYRLCALRKVVFFLLVAGCKPPVHPFALWFKQYHCDIRSTITAPRTLHCVPIRRQPHNCQYTLPTLSLCCITPHRRWALVMFLCFCCTSTLVSRALSSEDHNKMLLNVCAKSSYLTDGGVHFTEQTNYPNVDSGPNTYTPYTHKLFIFVCIQTVYLHH